MRKVYLDHSATTPVHPEVIKIMTEYMAEHFGNPSSIHAWGRQARKGVEEARERVARLIGAQANEIVFTSGGTEADNLAIKGIAEANRKKGNHIITSAIEHHAILHTCQHLEKEGYKVTYLPVDEFGLVNPEDVRKAVTDETILVTIMLGNNEVGTIQPIAEIARIAHEKGALVHTDAVQAVGQIPVDVDELGVDLLSLSAHKIYGPKGIGVLYVRKRTRIAPIAHGGGHERRLRAGTENVPGIVGLGKAAELAHAELEKRSAHLMKLRDRFLEGALKIPYSRLNGHPTRRLPNNANISVQFIEGESILLNLDMKGIAASSGSACTSGSLDPSHVLLAMGISHEVAHGSLRFTFGKDNTEEDVDYVLTVLPEIVERMRSMSPLWNEVTKSGVPYDGTYQGDGHHHHHGEEEEEKLSHVQ